MKNVKSILAAALVAAGLGTSASAVTIQQIIGTYEGPLLIKYLNYDVGTLYPNMPNSTTNTNPNAIPNQIAPPSLVALTGGTSSPYSDSDSWGIFKVSSIEGRNNQILWQAPSAFNNIGFEITGVFWGENDTQVTTDAVGNVNIHGVDMSIAFYADTAKNFTSTSIVGGVATAIDGQLIWTANSVPGVLQGDPVTEFDTSFKATSNNTLTNVVGAAWMKTGPTSAGTGALNTMFSPLTPSHDLEVQFTGATESTSAWLVDSNDPVRAAAVPTPTAVWGGVMLAGMIGLNVIRRRRAE